MDKKYLWECYSLRGNSNRKVDCLHLKISCHIHFLAHLHNSPPHTNRVAIAIAFCYVLGMHHVIYWLYPTKSIQINIVIGGEPPNPHLKPCLINQPGIKYMVGDSAVLPISFYMACHISCDPRQACHIRCHVIYKKT